MFGRGIRFVLLVAVTCGVALAACGGGSGGGHQDSHRVHIPKTGLTQSFDANVPQADDGALQRGVAWPSPRFHDNGDGTIIDRLTGLVWPAALDMSATADCPAQAAPYVTWQDGLDHVACLNAHAYLGQTDWREANVNELESLFDFGQAEGDAWFVSNGFDAAPGYVWASDVGGKTPSAMTFGLTMFLQGIDWQDKDSDGSAGSFTCRPIPVRGGD